MIPYDVYNIRLYTFHSNHRNLHRLVSMFYRLMWKVKHVFFHLCVAKLASLSLVLDVCLVIGFTNSFSFHTCCYRNSTSCIFEYSHCKLKFDTLLNKQSYIINSCSRSEAIWTLYTKYNFYLFYILPFNTRDIA